MASKASTIYAVNLDTDRVTSIPFGHKIPRTDRWSYVSKIDKIATLKLLGVSFIGSPQHYTMQNINSLWEEFKARSDVREFNFSPTTTPTPKEPIVATTTPTPNRQPKVEGSLDTILQGVIADVIGNYVPEVNPETVGAIVNETMNPYLEIFRNLTDQVASLNNVIATMQPKVTNITVNGNAPRKVDGVLHRDFEKILALATLNHNIYLVGPAGSGKSTIPEQVAFSLGLRFAAQSCGQTDSKFDYVGYRDANGNVHGTLFRDMWENGGVFLLDEMDNASPDMLVTLNQALANGNMAFPDAMVKKHPEFIMFGAGNTFGNGATAQFVGRSPQDGAFMDRFIKWVVDVDHNVEDAMVNAVPMESELRNRWVSVIRTCRTNAESKGLRVMVTPRQTVRGAQMLATGKFSIKEVVMSQFGFGLDSNQFAKVTEGVTL
jgi:hypothetical protein